MKIPVQDYNISFKDVWKYQYRIITSLLKMFVNASTGLQQQYNIFLNTNTELQHLCKMFVNTSTLSTYLVFLNSFPSSIILCWNNLLRVGEIFSPCKWTAKKRYWSCACTALPLYILNYIYINSTVYTQLYLYPLYSIYSTLQYILNFLFLL